MSFVASSLQKTQSDERDDLRHILKNLLEKRALESAMSVAYTLTTSDGYFEDYVNLCQCLYLSGDVSRSISILESCGVSSSVTLDKASKTIEQLLSETVLRCPAKDDLLLLSSVLLLVQCMVKGEDYRDSSKILEKVLGPFLTDVDAHTIYFMDSPQSEPQQSLTHALSQLFCLSGKCCDEFDQKKQALVAFRKALAIDHKCIVAFEYLIRSPLLNLRDKELLLHSCIQRCSSHDKPSFPSFYNMIMGQEQAKLGQAGGQDKAPQIIAVGAEYYFNRGDYARALTLSRSSLLRDPLSPHFLLLSLSCMVILSRTEDLFSLSHELMSRQPRQAISCYAVSCYYYTVGVMREGSGVSQEKQVNRAKARDLCLSYLRKACKMDSRLAHAHILLGHILGAMEESDQSLAAYRTACRLLPQEGKVWVFIAQELLRVNNAALCIHALHQAHNHCGPCALIYNELGVASVKLHRVEDALIFFEKACWAVIDENGGRFVPPSPQFGPSSDVMSYNPYKFCLATTFANYGTILRSCQRYSESIIWFERALQNSPTDGYIITSLGLSLHLMRRFDEAIEAYHRSLALLPKFNLASDLLSHALEDSLRYLPYES